MSEVLAGFMRTGWQEQGQEGAHRKAAGRACIHQIHTLTQIPIL